MPPEVGKRAERFFQWRHWIEAMYLVEIDVIGIQTLEACFHFLHDVEARQPHLVRTASHSPEDFCGNHHILAPDSQRFCRASSPIRRPSTHLRYR